MEDQPTYLTAMILRDVAEVLDALEQAAQGDAWLEGRVPIMGPGFRIGWAVWNPDGWWQFQPDYSEEDV